MRAEKVIRDTFPGFDESNVSRVVCRVTQALTAKLGDFKRFPSTRAEQDDIKKVCFDLVVSLVPANSACQ